MSYVVDPMQPEDIDEVIEIEKEAFTVAWSAAAYRRELEENRMARYIVLRELAEDVAEPDWRAQGGEAPQPPRPILWRLAERLRSLASPTPTSVRRRGRIVGYVGLWLMVDEAHLTTIAVRSECRGRGFGELLLVKALEIARYLDARVMTLEVRVANTVAQGLYRKFGFQVAGVRRRYYTDNNEDALIMTTEDLSSAEFASRFEGLRTANASRTGISDPV